jgi:hypothetical protein
VHQPEEHQVGELLVAPHDREPRLGVAP